MAKVAFLLGAGASFPFGIPMMRQFYERFIEYIGQRRDHCLPLVEKLTAGTAIPDLEVLIQRLENVRAIRSGLAILGSEDEGVSSELVLADELRGYLDMFLIETCEQFDLDKVKTKLSRFVKQAYETDAYIFTTNYDRLVEVAALSARIPLSDGFEAPSSRPESRWNGDFSRALRLVKLHGSVNWYEEEESDSLYRLERGYSLPSYEYRLTHGNRALRPLMIIPTLEKAVLKQPYARLLMQFGDALRDLELFVVIGNSLRDDHLRNTVMERAQGLEIVLINPAARDQKELIGRPEATHVVPLGMEQFIENGLTPFSELLGAIAQTSPDVRRASVASFASKLTALADDAASMSEAEGRHLLELKHGSVDSKLEVLRLVRPLMHSVLLSEVRSLALGEGDETVRIAAIDAFVAARGADSCEVLAEIVKASGQLSVRAEAALALQSVAGPAHVELVRRTSEAVANDKAIAALFRNA
jgi:hypothetical protein